MSVPFTRLVSQAIDNYGDQMLFDNLMRFDGIIYVMGRGGAIDIEVGGQPQFRERLLYGQNSNVAFRGKNSQITTVDDEGITMAAVNQPIISGAIVVNQVELDQVAGNSKLGAGLIKDKTQQFASTYVQVIADALRQATPSASLDPLTLLPSATTGTVQGILIARTPAQQATDAATTAGISRGDNSWWRNQYSNTSYDLTASAGRQGLYNDVYAKCVRGASKQFEPDYGIASTVALASLGAAADNNRRGTYQDEASMNLGYDNIKFYNAVLIRDSSAQFLVGAKGKIAFINTRALRLKVLRGQGKVKNEWLDQNNNLKSVPINWKHEMQSDIDSLNYVTVGYCVLNLVPKSLQDHGLADNCS